MQSFLDLPAQARRLALQMEPSGLSVVATAFAKPSQDRIVARRRSSEFEPNVHRAVTASKAVTAEAESTLIGVSPASGSEMEQTQRMSLRNSNLRSSNRRAGACSVWHPRRQTR
jgi:hypothetical protein